MKHDESSTRATIVTPSGRLPKSLIDDLCTYLGGASIVDSVVRKSGRLSLTLDQEGLLDEKVDRHCRQALEDLVALRDRCLANRDRRETRKRRDAVRRLERQEKVFLADAGRYVGESDTLRLLDEQEAVALSREIPELNDPTPAYSTRRTPIVQSEILYLDSPVEAPIAA